MLPVGERRDYREGSGTALRYAADDILWEGEEEEGGVGSDVGV